jgi:hypothetical protein
LPTAWSSLPSACGGSGSNSTSPARRQFESPAQSHKDHAEGLRLNRTPVLAATAGPIPASSWRPNPVAQAARPLWCRQPPDCTAAPVSEGPASQRTD